MYITCFSMFSKPMYQDPIHGVLCVLDRDTKLGLVGRSTEPTPLGTPNSARSYKRPSPVHTTKLGSQIQP
jgi:hypothetical protein